MNLFVIIIQELLEQTSPNFVLALQHTQGKFMLSFSPTVLWGLILSWAKLGHRWVIN